jgi:predicted site-specific integrase-resolvase
MMMPENAEACAPQGKPTRHLNQVELSGRWSISPRTLERWRWLGQGPQYLKIGGRVVYRLDDVEAYEAEQVRTSTANTAGVLSNASR